MKTTSRLNILLIQLPIPQINFGKNTANVPLAAAYLNQTTDDLTGVHVEILPETIASYLSDTALIEYIRSFSPQVVGFSIYNWNLSRSIHLAARIKETCGALILFGGPEITADNPCLFQSPGEADFFVIGEGESAFRRLLESFCHHLPWPPTPSGKQQQFPSAFFHGVRDRASINENVIHGWKDLNFVSRPSPYVAHLLDPHVDRLLYLESQRGCIYRCGFCYYHKSRKDIMTAEDAVICNAVQWAKDNQVEEICFIDPSFNARPGLDRLLKKIAEINADRSISLNAEIRAEYIDPQLADGFAAAGFTSFEIGLQSTNLNALCLMNRKTDLNRFLYGTTLLKERGMIPKIDLIIGLPGDDLNGFKNTLIFVAENNLADDIQIFPLSVLPGTAFRKRSRQLGLEYEPFPPYLIQKTPTYSLEDIYLSFDYAESLFDVSLFPAPYLDIAFKHKKKSNTDSEDVWIKICHQPYIKMLVCNSIRSHREIHSISRHLTSPYQILIGPSFHQIEFIHFLIQTLTKANPFTPLEIIFLNPKHPPQTDMLLASVKLHRPNYLDAYFTYQYNVPGNRSVLFTVVSDQRDIYFEGVMMRQVFWWKKRFLPDWEDLEELSEFEGILMDASCSNHETMSWQDTMAARAHDMPHISFADIEDQKRWLGLTASDEFCKLFLS